MFKKCKILVAATFIFGAFTPLLNSQVAHATVSMTQTIEKDVSDYVDNYEFVHLNKLDSIKQIQYKETLKKVLSSKQYTRVNKDRVISLIDDFIAKENGFVVDSTYSTRASFWDGQGITVDEMAATLNTAIGLIVAGGIGAFTHIGKHEAISVLRRVIKQFFGNFWVSNGLLSWIANLLDPGKAIAQWWDSRDAYPYNGRINF